jgi:hypothetical protein
MKFYAASPKLFILEVTAILLLLIINPFTRLYASEADPSLQDLNKEPDAIHKTTSIDNAQEEISMKVASTAKWIDSFFKDESYQIENNTTNLWVRLDTFKEEGEKVKFNFNPILSLVLPYTEKKLHLEIISSTDEDLVVYNEKPPLENTQLVSSKKEPTSATLRYFFLAKDTLNLSMAAGAYVDNNQPHFYIGPRSRFSFSRYQCQVTFIEWLRWVTSGGFESETRIDTDYQLKEKLLFRTRLEGDWRSDKNEFLHSVSFLLYQKLSKNRVFGYEWNNLFTTKPTHRLEEINLRVKYRQRIWRDWLFAEIAPQVSFPRERDFYRTLGILFRIELYFGPEF